MLTIAWERKNMQRKVEQPHVEVAYEPETGALSAT